jgi:hypothetical protein
MANLLIHEVQPGTSDASTEYKREVAVVFGRVYRDKTEDASWYFCSSRSGPTKVIPNNDYGTNPKRMTVPKEITDLLSTS